MVGEHDLCARRVRRVDQRIRHRGGARVQMHDPGPQPSQQLAERARDLPVGCAVGLGKIGPGIDGKPVNRHALMHIRLIALAGRRYRALDVASLQRVDQGGDVDFGAADIVREIGERHMENRRWRELARSPAAARSGTEQPACG